MSGARRSGQALAVPAKPASGLGPSGFDPSRIAEVLAEGDGMWLTCSGCHESEDGHDVGYYPFSETLGCKLGGGCSECGGIGATWDTTDWEDFASYSIEQDKVEESRRLELRRLANGLCHVLSEKLQHRTTGSDPKLNGYTYAEVPEWLLRQWLERVTNLDRSLGNASAIEARSDATGTGAAVGESAAPQEDAQTPSQEPSK